MQRTPSTIGIGERLLGAGLITPVQLELAECELKRRGGALTKVLVDLNLVAAEKVAEFIARESRTRYVDLSRLPLTEEVMSYR